MADNTVTTNFNIFDNSVAVIKNSSSPLDYFFRYRLVTDEGTALSEWSEINQETQGSISAVLGAFVSSVSGSSVESGGVGMNVKWTVPNSFPTNKFDVYFSWSYDNGSTYTAFEYTDTVTANNYFIKIPSGAEFLKVAVQVPTNIKIVNTNALLIQSGAISTLPILDSGTI